MFRKVIWLMALVLTVGCAGPVMQPTSPPTTGATPKLAR